MQAEQSPVNFKTMFPDDVKELTGSRREGTYTLLDVRQPFEYEEQHLPGAVLIPLPDLTDSLGKLDSRKPTIVYCAVGGRSRMAAQLLANQGFREIYQLEGGIEAWEDRTATGPREFHLKFIRGDEEPGEAIRVAYQMEEGLKRFHELMRAETKDPDLRDLLAKLIEAEESHERSLLDLLSEQGRPAVSAGPASGRGEEKMAARSDRSDVSDWSDVSDLSERSDLSDLSDTPGAVAAVEPVEPAEMTGMAPMAGMMEGGVAANDFVNRNKRFLQSVAGYLELAMMIETQALDLYLRMAAESRMDSTKSVLLRIADEEKAHLAMLARFLEEKGR